MSRHAKLFTLRLIMAQLIVGCFVVAVLGAQERQAIDGRVDRLDEWRVKASADIAVLQEIASEVKETRRIQYGLALTVLANLAFQYRTSKRQG